MSGLRIAVAIALLLSLPAVTAAQAELTGTYVRYFAVAANGRFMSGSHTFQYTESGAMPYSCDFFYPGSPYEGFTSRPTRAAACTRPATPRRAPRSPPSRPPR
ncbi:MAG: hypothetical protein M5U28_50075 [Sandaracinaceae bacterium]|nr:hypothetical protein [Sandaracinaceae bacterium]